MNKEQIALLFDRDRTVISRHIKNLFNDGELIEKEVCAKNARTGPDGKNYNSDFEKVLFVSRQKPVMSPSIKK